jgi:hypothetical protein
LATSEELAKWAAVIRAWAQRSGERDAVENLLRLADELEDMAKRKRTPADDELIQAMVWIC